MRQHTLFEVLEEQILLSGTLEMGFGDLGVDPGAIVASVLVSVTGADGEASPIIGSVDLLDIAAYPAPNAS